MSGQLKDLQTRNVDEGVVRLILEDCETSYKAGPGYKLHGVKEGSFKLEIDSDENKTEGEIQALYGRILSANRTLKIGKYPVDALKETLGSSVVIESATECWHHITKASQLPYVQLITASRFIPRLEGQARALIIGLASKASSMSYNIGQDGFAEVELEVKNEFTEFKFDTNGERLLTMGGEMKPDALADGVTYLPPSQDLPLWAPDASSGWTQRTQDVNAIQQRVYESDVAAEYMEWTRVLGEGTNILNLIGPVGPDMGRLVVKLDGELVGQVDFYNASATDNDTLQIALTVTTSGTHAIRVEVTDENPASTDNMVQIASAFVAQQGTTAVTVTNTLPNPVTPVYQIPAFQYSDHSGVEPEVVTVSPSNGAEKIQQEGLGEWREYQAFLEPGTYSLKAMLGKGADYGSLTFSVYQGENNSSVGVVDTYAGSTETPTLLAVPGTFTVESRRLVRVRMSCATKNASSTGYKSLMAWLGIYRDSTDHEILFGDDGPHNLELYPWQAKTATNWAGAAGTVIRNWVYTSSGADREIDWGKQVLLKGTYRARVAAEIEASGSALELHFSGAKVADFSLLGTAETNGRVEDTFTVAATAFADLVLKNPGSTAAKVYYLYLERIA